MGATLHAMGREAILVMLIASAPPLTVALLVGLVTGILQAATQIQEQSIGLVLRLVAVLTTLAVTAPFICHRLTRFSVLCLELAAQVSR